MWKSKCIKTSDGKDARELSCSVHVDRYLRFVGGWIIKLNCFDILSLKCIKNGTNIIEKIQLLYRSDDASYEKDARKLSFSVHVSRYLPFVGGWIEEINCFAIISIKHIISVPSYKQVNYWKASYPDYINHNK